MQDADFSDEFCRFIQRFIPTVEAAELLLALSAQPDVWREPLQLLAKRGSAFSITNADASRYLEIFRAGGLLAMGPDQRVMYRPETEVLAADVHTLAQAYEQRPVTLIRMIY